MSEDKKKKWVKVLEFVLKLIPIVLQFLGDGAKKVFELFRNKKLN
jgi:hypothetical protein